MEQSDAGKCHYHIILVAAVDNSVITHGAAGLCDVLYAALVCSLDIVGEGEECVGAQGHILHLIQPCSLFFSGEYRGLHLEDGLPYAVCKYVLVLIAHVNVNSVVSVGSAKAVYKLQTQHLGRLTQEPVVSLAAGKSGTVDTGLLTGTDTDGLTVLYVANRVGLGVF